MGMLWTVLQVAHSINYKPTVGLEPTTYGLQNRCSIQLSYTGIKMMVIIQGFLNLIQITLDDILHQ